MCREAIEAFRGDNRDKVIAEAGRTVGACGAEGAVAIAAAVRAHRHSTDVTLLDGITRSAGASSPAWPVDVIEPLPAHFDERAHAAMTRLVPGHIAEC